MFGRVLQDSLHLKGIIYLIQVFVVILNLCHELESRISKFIETFRKALNRYYVEIISIHINMTIL